MKMYPFCPLILENFDHVRTVENKIAKNIGLLHRVSQFLNEDSLKTVCF